MYHHLFCNNCIVLQVADNIILNFSNKHDTGANFSSRIVRLFASNGWKTRENWKFCKNLNNQNKKNWIHGLSWDINMRHFSRLVRLTDSKIVWLFKKGKNRYFVINSQLLSFTSSNSEICRTATSTRRATLFHHVY